MTKYATGVFFVLTVTVFLLSAAQARKKGTLEETLSRVKEAPAALPPGPAKGTDSGMVPTNMPGTAPASATTNAAPKAPSTNQPQLLTPAAPPAAPDKGK